MSAQLEPYPISRDDGGTDFKMTNCHRPCYSVNQHGRAESEKQCPQLKVSVYGLECLDDDC